MHDILETFTNTWLAVFEQVLSEGGDRSLADMGGYIVWQKARMVSLNVVREFMLPYIKRIGDFLKARGVKHILLDTDGDCNALIPLFMEAGVTGMYPFEVHCGMDVAKVRREYPKLQILGGISKSEIAKGPANIERILLGISEMLKKGGYVPFGDHFIPPDVSFEDFTYYRTRLNEMIDRCGR